MSKTGENIYRRKDGRWEGRYVAGYDPLSGKVRYGYVYAESYEKAREYKQQRLEESRRERLREAKRDCETRWGQGTEWNAATERIGDIERRGKRTKTVGDCLHRWLAGKEADPVLHPSTVQLYRRHIQKHLLPALGDCRLERLTVEVLEGFQKEKRESGRLDGRGGLSQSAVEGLMGILYAMLQEAREKGELQETPNRRNRKSIRRFQHEGQAFSEEEQQKIEKALFRRLRGQTGRELYLGILCAIYTGLRVGELAGLQWRDIDLKKSTISVRRTLQRIAAPEGSKSKTVLQLGPPKSESSRRTFPIKEELTAILRKYKKSLPKERTEPEAPVFGNERGKYSEPRLFQKYFAKLLQEAGVEKRKFHALRHTFATRCIETNMDIQSLSECLGHSNGKITLQVYTHSFTEHKKRCMKKLSFLRNIDEAEVWEPLASGTSSDGPEPAHFRA